MGLNDFWGEFSFRRNIGNFALINFIGKGIDGNLHRLPGLDFTDFSFVYKNFQINGRQIREGKNFTVRSNNFSRFNVAGGDNPFKRRR